MKKTKIPCPPGYREVNGECVKAGTLDGKSAKIGVGAAITGMAGVGVKAIVDKVKAKKVAKKVAATNAQNNTKTGIKLGGKKKLILKRK